MSKDTIKNHNFVFGQGAGEIINIQEKHVCSLYLLTVKTKTLTELTSEDVESVSITRDHRR